MVCAWICEEQREEQSGWENSPTTIAITDRIRFRESREFAELAFHEKRASVYHMEMFMSFCAVR